MKKRNLAITLALSILVFLVFVYLFWDYSIDDAFITFRYAENLVNGHGLAFNPGGKPVEAYSNFLWLLVLAVVYWFGLPTYLSAKILGVLCFLLSALIWTKHGLKEHNRYVWLTGPLFLLTPIAAFWAVSGLELGLYSLLLVGFGIGILKKSKLAFLIGILMVLIRMEGFVIALVIVLSAWAADFIKGERQRKYYIINIIILAIALAGLITFRLITFGYLMPNTFYMKLAVSSRGFMQLITGLIYFLPITLLFFWGWYRILARKQYDRDLIVFSAAFISEAAITCAANAVMNFHFRYMIPFLPFLLFVVLQSLSEIGGKKLRTIILILVCLSLLTPLPKIRDTIGQERKIVASQSELIKYINSIPGPLTISLTDIGRIPYYTKATYYDLWGLASEDIAHKGYRALTEYLRFPDYFIFVGYVKNNKLIGRFGNERMITQYPGFNQAYKLAFIAHPEGTRPDEPGYYYVALRKDQQAVETIRRYIPPEYIH